MRHWHRLVGLVLLAAIAFAPLGVAAEGYVCASGKRMVHETRKSPAACTHCPMASSQTATGAAYERPCCVYVGSTALPPVVSSAAAVTLDRAHPAPVELPGATASAVAPGTLLAIPQYESGGAGVPPPPLALTKSLILRN